MRKKAKIYIVLIIILGLFVSGIFAYNAGYRFTNNFTIGKIGIVQITLSLTKTSVIVDQSKRIVTSKENEVVEFSLSPTKHSVIISHGNYYPWTKNFVVLSEKTVTLHPFMTAINPTGFIITKEDPEYAQIKESIERYIPPHRDSPIVSEDNTAKVWLENNSVMLQVGTTTETVISRDTIIRNVDFYKNRSDVVVFSTLRYIYAIETDKSGTQNFMPIYKGEKPSFIKADENSLYVQDGEALMQVAL